MKKLTKQLRYYYKNRERLREYSKKFIKENPERAKIWHNKYIFSAKGKYSQIKKTRKDKLKISQNDFINWFNNTEKKCTYCGIKEDELKEICLKLNRKLRTEKLTIDRIDNNKDYEVDNLAFACDICNQIKSNIFSFEEMKKIGEMIKNKY